MLFSWTGGGGRLEVPSELLLAAVAGLLGGGGVGRAHGRLYVDFFENHLAELGIVDLSIIVGVSLGNHFLDLLIGKPLAEVHHAVLELALANIPVPVAVKHPVN